MTDKIDKERRKQILNDLRKNAREEFQNSLPMSAENFAGLFDYLDQQLGEKPCNDDHTMTKCYLGQIGIQDTEKILEWLMTKDGYCDCEVLANVEEQFDGQ